MIFSKEDLATMPRKQLESYAFTIQKSYSEDLGKWVEEIENRRENARAALKIWKGIIVCVACLGCLALALIWLVIK